MKDLETAAEAFAQMHPQDTGNQVDCVRIPFHRHSAFLAGAAWQRAQFVAWLKEQDDTGFGGTMSGEWLAEEFAKTFDGAKENE